MDSCRFTCDHQGLHSFALTDDYHFFSDSLNHLTTHSITLSTWLRRDQRPNNTHNVRRISNPKPKDSDKPPAAKSTKPHREAKLYQVLLTRFLSRYIRYTCAGACREDCARDVLFRLQGYACTNLPRLPRVCRRVFREIGARLPEEERHGLLPAGILSVVWQATRPTLNQVDTRNDPVFSDVLLPADVRFTQEAFERGGVGSAVTTIQHTLARFQTGTRVSMDLTWSKQSLEGSHCTTIQTRLRSL